MKRYSAQYIITNSGPMLKRAVINVGDDGTIISIEDTGGILEETHSVEFYNGIIIPGFVNCHCHLELSHMKGFIPPGSGLGKFTEQVRQNREINKEKIFASAQAADIEMYNGGVVLCADICNTSSTFKLKTSSRIRYINLLEVFGIDPEKAIRRIDEIDHVAEIARRYGLSFNIVPHSAYSMSKTLFRLLRERSEKNDITSIHFMETAGEKAFLENHSGELMRSYERSGLLPPELETANNHADIILTEITQSGRLILVHNTFANKEIIRTVKKRKNLFWCLCPASNMYIENTIPPVDLLIKEGCEIVIGTDSLASNNKLDILSELIMIQAGYPDLSVEDLILWATLNGARALGKEDHYGKIESGKNPGLLLIQNVDLISMKLLPESFITRLI